MAPITLVIACLHNHILPATVKYFSTHQVYVIGRAPLFLSYIKTILDSHANDSISAVLIYDDLTVVLDVLDVLHKASSPANVEVHKQKYLSNYKSEMARVSGARHPAATPPQGHDDVALGLQLCILQPCDFLQGLDHLLERNVAIQQILRFMALIHGATYAAVSGLLKVANDGPKLALLARDLVTNDIDGEMHVYDVTGSTRNEEVVIHQLTPPAWDSWTKIEVAAKSIHRSDGEETFSGRMLDLNETFFALYECYMDYFGHSENGRLEAFLDELVQTEPPSSREELHLLTYDETISKLQKVK